MNFKEFFDVVALFDGSIASRGHFLDKASDLFFRVGVDLNYGVNNPVNPD